MKPIASPDSLRHLLWCLEKGIKDMPSNRLRGIREAARLAQFETHGEGCLSGDRWNDPRFYDLEKLKRACDKALKERKHEKKHHGKFGRRRRVRAGRMYHGPNRDRW